MARLIGLDVGTSGTKALMIDETGAIIATASRPHTLQIPQPAWAEQNPEEWLQAAIECLEELGADRADGIGLTGQMHGSVFLDENGESIRPALLWCDQRTVDQCRAIEEAVGPEELRRITGNPALTGFQLPKILWLRDNEPENFARLHRVLLPKDYIRMKLTGEEAADVSDASGVGCLDLATRDWSPDVLAAVNVDRALLPRVVESGDTAGLYKGVPVAGGGGDQAAAAVGTGAVSPGIVSVSLGTSGVVFEACADAPETQHDAIHSFCHATGGWHRMGVMLSCGGSVRWARDILYGEDAGWEAMNTEAAAAPAGCDGLTFLPHLSGERCPYVDPEARGAFAGLASYHTRGHMARSVIEGVCYGLAESLDLLSGGRRPKVVRVTGGGVSSPLWIQVLADVLECPCEMLETDEGPAFGAAILGGVAAGVWPSAQAGSEAVVRVKSTVGPSGQTYRREVDRHRSLYPSLLRWRDEIS